MSQVAIEKVDDSGTLSSSVMTDVKNLFDRVRQRAFQFFENREGRPGSEVDDWLKAEEDLIWAPESDLVEKDGKFELQMALPGFDAEDVHVAATPETLIVCAETTHKHEESEGDVQFCEFGEKQLFRQLNFPVPVDLDKMTANLDKGILRISATKAAAKPSKVIAAAA